MSEKPTEKPEQRTLELKSHGEWSHNCGEAERRMVILVELLARHAAEKDFEKLHNLRRSRYLH